MVSVLILFKFTDDEVIASINKLIYEAIQPDNIKRTTVGKKKKKRDSADNQDDEVSETKAEAVISASATTDDNGDNKRLGVAVDDV